MEIYTLDDLGRRIHVIDDFLSLIWTERFSSYGDFQLKLISTSLNRSKIETNTRLVTNESYRVMIAETIEDTEDVSGAKILNITGRSLETILLDRLCMPEITNLADVPKWLIEDPPKDIAEFLFDHVCISGNVIPTDIIPFTSIANVAFPVDTIAAPTETVSYEIVEPANLYDAEKTICDAYEMGFRLIRNGDNSNLYFDIYMGCDRTTQQSTLTPVIFRSDLDNLRNTRELKSVQGYKNVVYVLGSSGFEIIHSEGTDISVTGFDKRILVVDAREMDDADPLVLSAKMTQRGKEELAKCQMLYAFDGEVSQYSPYKYGIDYNLGDLVELQNTDGFITTMRVTEQIFVSDREGDKSYPTLSVNKFITPGSWASWEYNQEWIDLESSSETWADQL
jgi:hypothetical protein